VGQVIREKPGTKRSQRMFYKRTFNGEQNCVTDREEFTSQIDYRCRMVDDITALRN